MYDPSKISALIGQAYTGDVPPHGNMWDAAEVIGFSFGLKLDSTGQLAGPGAVNEALAGYIVRNEELRYKNMHLQEEIANAVLGLDRSLAHRVNVLPTMKAPGNTYSSPELVDAVAPDLRERHVDTLGVLAFRHHLPRANAHVQKAGFETAVPELRDVGDFDPNSAQPWTRSRGAWIRREAIAICGFAALNKI